jgi:hypothetical protein
MIILRATRREEVSEIATADSLHKSGAHKYQVHPWLINEGSLTVKISYSDRSLEIS